MRAEQVKEMNFLGAVSAMALPKYGSSSVSYFAISWSSELCAPTYSTTSASSAITPELLLIRPVRS